MRVSKLSSPSTNLEGENDINPVIDTVAIDRGIGYHLFQSEECIPAANMSNYPKAPKKTTSVSVAESLLAEAKALGINVSQAAEEGLAKAVSTKRAEQWIQENWDAIPKLESEYVEEHGLPLAKYRMF